MIGDVAASNSGLLLLLFAPNLNPLRLRQRRFRNADRQDAILKLTLDLFLIDSLRQLEGTYKSTVGPLDDLVAVILAFLALALLLPADRQDPIVSHDFHVLWF